MKNTFSWTVLQRGSNTAVCFSTLHPSDFLSDSCFDPENGGCYVLLDKHVVCLNRGGITTPRTMFFIAIAVRTSRAAQWNVFLSGQNCLLS
jgi:mannose/cellobiose epimerase-like protein (N-acyl-D-glucosamine 2-epimerase family)